jgi:AmmeMemoRadiSam system protein A
MGQPSFALLEKFAASLKEVVGNRNDVLIVVSTDLSHYHPDIKARAMDASAIKAITSLDAKTVWEGCRLRSAMEMCGFVPTTAALLYARQRGLTQARMLRYANSGDVTGDRDGVVGYASVIIYGDPQGNEDKDALTPAQKKRLLEIARQTMEEYVRTGKTLEFRETDPRLLMEEGAFVTIHMQGRLRGCIGNILGRGPLYRTVRDMAIAAATQDPRFDPVQAEELKDLDVEVSVLSKPRVIRDVDEIVMGKHGVIVSQGPWRQGVFLPQVAVETGWSKEEFLNQLCAQKAGLARDAWKDPKTKIEIFTAQVFGEKDVQ